MLLIPRLLLLFCCSRSSASFPSFCLPRYFRELCEFYFSCRSLIGCYAFFSSLVSALFVSYVNFVYVPVSYPRLRFLYQSCLLSIVCCLRLFFPIFSRNSPVSNHLPVRQSNLPPVLAPSASFHPACQSICVWTFLVLPTLIFCSPRFTHVSRPVIQQPLSQSTALLALPPPYIQSHPLFLTLSRCPPAHRGSNSAPSSLSLSFNLNLPYPTHVSPTFLRPAPHHICAFLSSLSRSLCVPSAPTYLAPLPFLVSGIYSTSRLHLPSSFSPDLPYYPRDFNVLAQKTRGYYLSSHR